MGQMLLLAMSDLQKCKLVRNRDDRMIDMRDDKSCDPVFTCKKVE